MDKKNVLYQIKSLQKMILRFFLEVKKKNCNDLKIKKIQSIPTTTQMQIMEYILNHENEDIYQRDLEEVLKLRRATVSGVLQTMEKNNLIKRVTYSEDSRTKKIILNDNAKSMFKEGEQKISELEKIIVKDISKEDLEKFFSVIEKMKENIENINKEQKSSLQERMKL